MAYEGFDWKGYLAYAGYPEDQIPESVTDEELAQIRDHWAKTVYQEELAIAAQDPFLETKKEREEQARDRLLALAPEYRQSFGLREAQPAEAAFSADEFREHVVNNPVQDAPLDYYLKTFAAKRIGKNTKYEYPYLEGLTKKDFEDLFMERNGIDPDLTTIDDIRNGKFGPAWMAQRAEEESNLPKGSAMRQGWLNFKKLTGLTTETFGDALGIEWMQNIGKGITENAINTIEEEGYKSKYGESLVDTFKTQGPFAAAGKVLEMAQENWATTGVPLALAGMSALFGIAARNPRLAAQGLAGARASLAAATSADVAAGTGAAATVGRVGASTIAKSLAFASALASGLEVGAVREELEEKGKEEGRQLYDPNDPGDVVAWGLLSAALDHVGNMMTFVGGGGLVRAAKGLVQTQQTRMLEAAEAAIRQAGKEAGKSWGRKIVEAMGTEGITEALQELPGIMAAKNKGVEYDAKEIRDRMIDAGVVGAFMGGGMRSVQALTERKPRTQSESTETPQQQQQEQPQTNVPAAPNQPPPPGFNVASNTNFEQLDKDGKSWVAWDGYNTGYGATKEEASQALIDQSNTNKDTIDANNVTSTGNQSRVFFGNGGEIVVTGNGHKKVIGDIISLHNANDNVVNLDGTKTHNFDATTLSGLSAEALRNRIEHSGKTARQNIRSVRKGRADQVDIAVNYDVAILDSAGKPTSDTRAEFDLKGAKAQLESKGYRILKSKFTKDSNTGEHIQSVWLYRDGVVYKTNLISKGDNVRSTLSVTNNLFGQEEAIVEKDLAKQNISYSSAGGTRKIIQQNGVVISPGIREGGFQIQRDTTNQNSKFINTKAIEKYINKQGGKKINIGERSITYEVGNDKIRLDLRADGGVVVSENGRFLGSYDFDGSALSNTIEVATYDLTNAITTNPNYSILDIPEELRFANKAFRNAIFVEDVGGNIHVIRINSNGGVQREFIPPDPGGLFERLKALGSMQTIEDVRNVYASQFRSGYVELVTDPATGIVGIKSEATGSPTNVISEATFLTSDQIDDIINNSSNPNYDPNFMTKVVKVVAISQYISSTSKFTSANIIDWARMDDAAAVADFVKRARGYGASLAEDSVKDPWNQPGTFNAERGAYTNYDLYNDIRFSDLIRTDLDSMSVGELITDYNNVNKAIKEVFATMELVVRDALALPNQRASYRNMLNVYSQQITQLENIYTQIEINRNRVNQSAATLADRRRLAEHLRRDFYRARLLQANLQIDILRTRIGNRIITDELDNLTPYDSSMSLDQVRATAMEAELMAVRLEEAFIQQESLASNTSVARQIWNAIYPNNSGVYGSFIQRIHQQGRDFRFSRDVNAVRAERHISLIDELRNHKFLGNGALSDLITNEKLIILETQQEIEDALLREGQAIPKYSELGNIQGFASNDNQRVYLSAWGIKQGDAFHVLLHEFAAHARRFGFSTAEFQQILSGIKANATAQTPEGHHIRRAMWRAQNAGVSPKSPVYWEEVAAYLVEEASVYSGTGILDQMQAWVKRWLFINGYIDATNFHYQDFTIFSLGMLSDSRIPFRLANGKFDYGRHANRIYDTRKFVESYVTEDIAKEIGYSREEVIEMVAAHLAGTYKAGNHVIGDLPDEDELMSHFPMLEAEWRVFDRDDTVEDSQTLRFSRDARLEEMVFDSEIYGAEEAEVIAQYNDIYEKKQQPEGSNLDEREWAVSQTRSFKDWIDARKNAVEWVRNQRIDTGIPIVSEIAPNKKLPERLKEFGSYNNVLFSIGFHSTRHHPQSFIDYLKYLGTGEGAQVHGIGVYVYVGDSEERRIANLMDYGNEDAIIPNIERRLYIHSRNIKLDGYKGNIIDDLKLLNENEKLYMGIGKEVYTVGVGKYIFYAFHEYMRNRDLVIYGKKINDNGILTDPIVIDGKDNDLINNLIYDIVMNRHMGNSSEHIANVALKHAYEKYKAIKNKKLVIKPSERRFIREFDELLEYLEISLSDLDHVDQGQQYKLNIPDVDNEMLQEDDLMSEQPENILQSIKDFLPSLKEENTGNRYFDKAAIYYYNKLVNNLEENFNNMNARNFYKELGYLLYLKKHLPEHGQDDPFGGTVDIFDVRNSFILHEGTILATQALREVGVKGIHYNGNYNGDCAVIFDGSDIEILETYFPPKKGIDPETGEPFRYSIASPIEPVFDQNGEIDATEVHSYLDNVIIFNNYGDNSIVADDFYVPELRFSWRPSPDQMEVINYGKGDDGRDYVRNVRKEDSLPQALRDHGVRFVRSLEESRMIQEQYAEAMKRQSDYVGNLNWSLLNRRRFIWENEGSFLAGLDMGDVFVMSHFAPKGIKGGAKMMKKAAESDMKFVAAVPPYQGQMLKKVGFKFVGHAPMPFHGEVILKDVYVNNAMTDDDINSIKAEFTQGRSQEEIDSLIKNAKKISGKREDGELRFSRVGIPIASEIAPNKELPQELSHFKSYDQVLFSIGWHATPHHVQDFTDYLKYLGTGEGAQVHGIGVYVFVGDNEERRIANFGKYGKIKRKPSDFFAIENEISANLRKIISEKNIKINGKYIYKELEFDIDNIDDKSKINWDNSNLLKVEITGLKPFYYLSVPINGEPARIFYIKEDDVIFNEDFVTINNKEQLTGKGIDYLSNREIEPIEKVLAGYMIPYHSDIITGSYSSDDKFIHGVEQIYWKYLRGESTYQNREKEFDDFFMKLNIDRQMLYDRGQQYKLNIPDVDTEMLQEDEDVDQQPEYIKERLLNIMDKLKSETPDYEYTSNDDFFNWYAAIKGEISGYTARDFYKYLSMLLYNIENETGFIEVDFNRVAKSIRTKASILATKALREAGIKGIHYYGRGDGDCAVIFDGSDIEILETYFPPKKGIDPETGEPFRYSIAQQPITSEQGTAIPNAPGMYKMRNGSIQVHPEYIPPGLETETAIYAAVAISDIAKNDPGLEDVRAMINADEVLREEVMTELSSRGIEDTPDSEFLYAIRNVLQTRTPDDPTYQAIVDVFHDVVTKATGGVQDDILLTDSDIAAAAHALVGEPFEPLIGEPVPTTPTPKETLFERMELIRQMREERVRMSLDAVEDGGNSPVIRFSMANVDLHLDSYDPNVVVTRDNMQVQLEKIVGATHQWSDWDTFHNQLAAAQQTGTTEARDYGDLARPADSNRAVVDEFIARLPVYLRDKIQIEWVDNTQARTNLAGGLASFDTSNTTADKLIFIQGFGRTLGQVIRSVAWEASRFGWNMVQTKDFRDAIVQFYDLHEAAIYRELSPYYAQRRIPRAGLQDNHKIFLVQTYFAKMNQDVLTGNPNALANQIGIDPAQYQRIHDAIKSGVGDVVSDFTDILTTRTSLVSDPEVAKAFSENILRIVLGGMYGRGANFVYETSNTAGGTDHIYCYTNDFGMHRKFMPPDDKANRYSRVRAEIAENIKWWKRFGKWGEWFCRFFLRNFPMHNYLSFLHLDVPSARLGDTTTTKATNIINRAWQKIADPHGTKIRKHLTLMNEIHSILRQHRYDPRWAENAMNGYESLFRSLGITDERSIEKAKAADAALPVLTQMIAENATEIRAVFAKTIDSLINHMQLSGTVTQEEIDRMAQRMNDYAEKFMDEYEHRTYEAYSIDGLDELIAMQHDLNVDPNTGDLTIHAKADAAENFIRATEARLNGRTAEFYKQTEEARNILRRRDRLDALYRYKEAKLKQSHTNLTAGSLRERIVQEMNTEIGTLIENLNKAKVENVTYRKFNNVEGTKRRKLDERLETDRDYMTFLGKVEDPFMNAIYSIDEQYKVIEKLLLNLELGEHIISSGMGTISGAVVNDSEYTVSNIAQMEKGTFLEYVRVNPEFQKELNTEFEVIKRVYDGVLGGVVDIWKANNTVYSLKLGINNYVGNFSMLLATGHLYRIGSWFEAGNITKKQFLDRFTENSGDLSSFAQDIYEEMKKYNVSGGTISEMNVLSYGRGGHEKVLHEILSFINKMNADSERGTFKFESSVAAFLERMREFYSFGDEWVKPLMYLNNRANAMAKYKAEIDPAGFTSREAWMEAVKEKALPEAAEQTIRETVSWENSPMAVRALSQKNLRIFTPDFLMHNFQMLRITLSNYTRLASAIGELANLEVTNERQADYRDMLIKEIAQRSVGGSMTAAVYLGLFGATGSVMALVPYMFNVLFKSIEGEGGDDEEKGMFFDPQEWEGAQRLMNYKTGGNNLFVPVFRAGNKIYAWNYVRSSVMLTHAPVMPATENPDFVDRAGIMFKNIADLSNGTMTQQLINNMMGRDRFGREIGMGKGWLQVVERTLVPGFARQLAGVTLGYPPSDNMYHEGRLIKVPDLLGITVNAYDPRDIANQLAYDINSHNSDRNIYRRNFLEQLSKSDELSDRQIVGMISRMREHNAEDLDKANYVLTGLRQVGMTDQEIVHWLTHNRKTGGNVLAKKQALGLIKGKDIYDEALITSMVNKRKNLNEGPQDLRMSREELAVVTRNLDRAIRMYKEALREQ